MASYYYVFNRKKSLKKGLGLVELRIYFSDERKNVFKSTKISISPNAWNTETNYLNEKYRDFKITDKQLQSFKAIIQDIELNCDVFTPQVLRSRLGDLKHQRNLNFPMWMERTINTTRGKSLETTTSHRQTLNKILLFDKRLSFKAIVRLETIEAFHDFLLDMDLSNGTIAKHHTILGGYITLAVKERRATYIHGESPYEDFTIERSVNDDKVILTDEEMNSLLSFNLSRKPSLERARDSFIIGYYTLARYGDYSDLGKENFISVDRDGKVVEMVKRIPDKTKGKAVMIPVHPNLKTLLLKYRYKPPRLTNLTLNKHIKTICRMVGIDELVEIVYSKGGKTYRESVKKYERVTTHTARRSGATTLIRRGVPQRMVMQLTGHTTEVSFNRYVMMGAETVAFDLSEIDFYKK